MSGSDQEAGECRHMPRPAWNPERCERCGAVLDMPGPAWARLRDVARCAAAVLPDATWVRRDLLAAIADVDDPPPG